MDQVVGKSLHATLTEKLLCEETFQRYQPGCQTRAEWCRHVHDGAEQCLASL